MIGLKEVTDAANTVVTVANSERQIAKDKGIAREISEREYILFDKEMINKTLLRQLELFEAIKDGKHLDKNGDVRPEHSKKIKELKVSTIAYSSMSTLELLGYATNKEYFFEVCEFESEDEKKLSTLLLGALVFLSMKRDVNPYIDLRLKPIILSLLNDYDHKKEKVFKSVFKKIKRSIDFDFDY